jgi:hypothetical protein
MVPRSSQCEPEIRDADQPPPATRTSPPATRTSPPRDADQAPRDADQAPRDADQATYGAGQATRDADQAIQCAKTPYATAGGGPRAGLNVVGIWPLAYPGPARSWVITAKRDRPR